MKTNFKRTVTTMLVAAALMLTAGVVTLGNSLNASAAVVTNENITVVESASLRLENFGLRFKTKIASEYLTNGMEVHTLMLPTSYLAGGELKVGVHNQLADFALDMNKTYQKGTDNYFNTVLTKIPQSQYGTEISMRAYVKNGDTIEYSANTVSTSVASVASSALSYNYELYEADLAKYLVKGIYVAEKNTYVVGQKNVSLGAGIEYFVETDETIAEKIAQKYALTYTSSDENVLTVSENGEVTALACGTSNVTVRIEALGLEKTCAVTVTQPSYGEVFDFENPVLSMVTVHKTDVQNDALASINEDGKLQVVLDTNGVDYHIRFKGVDGTKLNFDWVKMTYSASFSSGEQANCMILFNGFYMGTATFTGATNGYTFTKSSADNNWDKIKSEKDFRVVVQHWRAGDTFTIVFHDIQFGYNDIVADNEENTTFDLTKKFSLTAGELTNVMFNGESVDDVTAFAPTQSGTLTFDVVKEGFATTSMSVNVTYTQVPRYNPVCCFDNPDLTKVSLNSTNAGKVEGSGISMLAGSDANGSYVEFTTNKGTWPNVRFGMSEQTATKLKKYDWFKIKIAAWQYTGATDLTSADAIRQTGTLVTGKTMTVTPHPKDTSLANQTINVNGSVYTLEWNRNAFASIFDTLVYGEWSSIGRWFRIVLNSTDTAPAIIRIYDIEFGYNDITSDGTALDLLTKFNATADELTATYTPDGGVAEAITNETAWTPAQSGTLTVTVKKTGYKAFTYTLKVTV